MALVELSDPTVFLHRANKFLFANEEINNLIISSSLSLAKATTARSPKVSFFIVEESAGSPPLAAAMRLADGRLVISTATPDAAASVGREVAGRGLEIKGVSGPRKEAQALCDAYADATSKTWTTKFAMKMMSLREPPSSATAPGLARQAKDKDKKLVLDWTLAFVKECRLDETERETEEMVLRYLEGRQLFIWEDAKPVAMAGFSGHTPSGIRVNMVYTDRSARGKGYAASVVQFVSRRLLQNEGKKFCFLFADAANPTSCGVYERLGYATLGEWLELRFKS